VTAWQLSKGKIDDVLEKAEGIALKEIRVTNPPSEKNNHRDSISLRSSMQSNDKKIVFEGGLLLL
jgi:hypothetical protein